MEAQWDLPHFPLMECSYHLLKPLVLDYLKDGPMQ
jgi:hypothetical protein